MHKLELGGHVRDVRGILWIWLLTEWMLPLWHRNPKVGGNNTRSSNRDGTSTKFSGVIQTEKTRRRQCWENFFGNSNIGDSVVATRLRSQSRSRRAGVDSGDRKRTTLIGDPKSADAVFGDSMIVNPSSWIQDSEVVWIQMAHLIRFPIIKIRKNSILLQNSPISESPKMLTPKHSFLVIQKLSIENRKSCWTENWID